jgi:hypothetical protein
MYFGRTDFELGLESNVGVVGRSVVLDVHNVPGRLDRAWLVAAVQAYPVRMLGATVACHDAL